MARFPFPLIALGGVGEANAQGFIEEGFAGVALLGYFAVRSSISSPSVYRSYASRHSSSVGASTRRQRQGSQQTCSMPHA